MQQLRQRVIATYHLGPMDKPETRGLRRASAEARRLARRSVVRRGCLRGDLSVHGRRAEAHQPPLQPRDARRVPRRQARHHGRRRRVGRGRDYARSSAPRPSRRRSFPCCGTRPRRRGRRPPPPRCGVRPPAPRSPRLEDRITRLERLVHSTVSLLHTLIQNGSRASRRGADDGAIPDTPGPDPAASSGRGPNFMKMAPLLARLRRERRRCRGRCSCTPGQHYDAAMSDRSFAICGFRRPT